MSLFQPIPIESKKEAQAPVAAKLAAFEKHKPNLLNKLQNVCKSGSKSEPFDADKSWDELTQLAQLYFWGQLIGQDTLPTRDRIKRLRQLAKALRQAHGLAREAIGDGLGDELYRARFAQKNISLISTVQIDKIDKDGSSILVRIVDEIKEMVGALATLETVSHAAATSADALSKTGRPALLPRDCVQGLARVYRRSTGSKPGRGAGPFADFAYEFMIAVGQTGFDYGSLTGAIQDAHRKFKPSWFDA